MQALLLFVVRMSTNLAAIVLPLATALVVFSSTPALADKQQQLSALRKEIKTVEKSLQATQQNQSSLIKQLKLSEIHISKLSRLIRTTDADMKQQKLLLASLQTNKNTLDEQVSDNRRQLALQLRSSHAIGQRGYLKVLLSAQNRAEVSRMLTYLDYLNRQQLQLIQQAKLAYSELQNTQKAIFERTKTLANDRSQQQADFDKLKQSKKTRTQLIAKLGQKITDKKQILQALKSDQNALSQLLDQFLPQSTDIPPLRKPAKPPPSFKSLKGKLPRPSVGKIVRRFGQAHIGNITSKGILYASPLDQPVLAVASGQVVYSDWLRGFGMLMIIDHGNQYMTLYGQNTSLHFESGDWVQAGEIIASSGSSGGLQASGLYFELRYRGKPINPKKWLKR